MIEPTTTLIDLAFIVCTALDRSGIVAVLTGGSAANFYAPQRYRSHDADFVITLEPRASNGRHVLEGLGFRFRDGLFAHPDSPFTVEFPPGPLAVGSDIVTTWQTAVSADRLLHVISRTDCIRDRLAPYYFWGDVQSLFTAIDVAKSGPFDLRTVREWSEREGNPARLAEFLRQLRNG
ncbi:MAG: hypothetical protein ACXWNK_14460 [Vulcanimicrobiaceae bacterium]